VKRALALALAVFALAGAAVWGCASGNARRDEKVAEIGGRPADPVPDGGWSNYRPDRRPYEPDPSRAAAGNPSMSPSAPVGHDLH
jgi:hypothetical protein